MTEPKFAFQKKLGVSAVLYGDPIELCYMIARLMVCMKECNKKTGTLANFLGLTSDNLTWMKRYNFQLGI